MPHPEQARKCQVLIHVFVSYLEIWLAQAPLARNRNKRTAEVAPRGQNGEWNPPHSTKCIPAAMIPSSSLRVALSKGAVNVPANSFRTSGATTSVSKRGTIFTETAQSRMSPARSSVTASCNQAQDEQLRCVDDLCRSNRQMRCPLLRSGITHSFDKVEELTHQRR